MKLIKVDIFAMFNLLWYRTAALHVHTGYIKHKPSFCNKTAYTYNYTEEKHLTLCPNMTASRGIDTTCDWHSGSIISTNIIIIFNTPLFHTTITVQSLYHLYVARTIAWWAPGVMPAEVAAPGSGRPCGVVLGGHKGDVAVHHCGTINRILHILSHSLRTRQLCNSTTNAIMPHYTRIYAHTSTP